MLSSDSFKHNKAVLFSALICTTFALFVCWDQYFFWKTNEDYSFGFIVPLFAVYIIKDRWPLIKSHWENLNVIETPSFYVKCIEVIAACILISSLLLLTLGAMIRAAMGPFNSGSLFIAGGFAFLLLSTIFLSAPRHNLSKRFRLTHFFIFPAFIWLLSIPLFPPIELAIKTLLLNKVTFIVFHLFNTLAFPIEQEGNLLILPEGSVGVAEACSGIRSLMASIFAGSFIAAVFLNAFWKKCLLVITAILVAFFTNILRSLFLTFWAYSYGPQAIEGTFHDVTGYAVLALTALILLALVPIFNLKLTLEDSS